MRNVTCWSRAKRKLARQQGQQYKLSSGKIVDAKSPCSGVLCNCKKDCSQKFSSEEIIDIFREFYNLDENSKNTHIFKSLKPSSQKVRLCDAKKFRAVTFTYFVTVGAEVRRVCQKAYLKLHHITNAKVVHIAKQVAEGFSAPRPDARGKHNTRPHRMSDLQLAGVVEHISMFPAEMSHYSRHSNPNRKYLASDLRINKMFKLYHLWSQEKGLYAVSAQSYRNVFNEKFNLVFGSPKSDTYSTCDAKKDE